ncbi:MAG TPA: serine hydrolase [Ferruginibacter sp.]|nr:serine hydrolase [Ferruginibacter sp.]
MVKFLLILLLPYCLHAQDYADKLKQFVQGQHDYFRFNGNVLVAKNGKVVYKDALGYADFNTGRLLDDNTVFELASVTKQFTAMAIMILKDRGALQLDDKVQKYLPSIPYDNITIRQLLSHTSGLPEYEAQFEKNWDQNKIAFNKDVITMLQQRKDSLLFKPGSKWQYSNTGYAMLASIIEKVSGMTYNDFLAKEVFKPLGMTHTYVYNTRRSTGKIPPNYALGFLYSDSLKRYILPDSLPRARMVYYLDGIVGDGTVNSTTGDLLVWDRALASGKLISPASINEMLSPITQVSPRDTTGFYGYGLFILTKPNGKVITHTGGWPGYTTFLERRTGKDETVIILSNNETTTGQFRAGIESILDGENILMPYKHTAVVIDPALLDKYEGKYNAFLTLTFIKKDNKLYRYREGTPDIELKPESNTKFFYGDGTDRQIEFETDTSGKVTRAWFINTGQRGEMKRLE